jgi:glycosyltransferase involved in cell wall biosynthesis
MGILKSHLLLQWPGNKIAHVVTSGQIDHNSKATRQFLITKRGVLFRQSGYELFHNENMSQDSNPPRQNSSKNSIIGEILNQLKLKLNLYFYKLYRPITHFHRSSAGVLSSRLFSFVESFKPEIVLTFAGTLPELKAAYSLSTKYKLPLIMYLTDDYITWIYKDIYFSRYFNSQLQKYFRLCLSSSIARFTVGFKMEQEYTKRYHLRFKTIMDGIDTNLYESRPVKSQKNEILFYYLGSLAPNRWYNLQQIGLALRQLNASQNKKLKLIIHSNDNINYAYKFKGIDCVEFREPIPFKEVSKYQMNADVLIHAESFEESMVAITKYAISTKIFQYLASGTPIFAFGPGNVASIEFLRDLKAAIIVDSKNMEVLQKQLLYSINNLSSLNTDCEKTRTYALNNLSIEASSKQFASEIINLYYNNLHIQKQFIR